MMDQRRKITLFGQCCEIRNLRSFYPLLFHKLCKFRQLVKEKLLCELMFQEIIICAISHSVSDKRKGIIITEDKYFNRKFSLKNFFCHFYTILFGHVNIKQQNIWVKCFDEFKTDGTIGCLSGNFIFGRMSMDHFSQSI